MKQIRTVFKVILPYIAVFFSVLFYYKIPETGNQKVMEYPYYIYLVLILIGIYTVLLLLSIFLKGLRTRVFKKAALFSGALFFMLGYTLLVCKIDVLPTLYFPSLDRIFGLIFEDKLFLLQNVAFSLRLLVFGWVFGLAAGFITGLFLGYSTRVGYWLNPITKIIGPIPSTAWVPLALSVFPTTFGANVFLLAFAVWFPVTIMTSTGIQGTTQVHYEVADTLGASEAYKILHVAIPSAMPSIFLGVFYGTVSSFATLMTVEMNGNSNGIGWYINWQKSVMMYDGVYGGLIVIAIMCLAILTVLFKVKDKLLVWQKGIIKW